MGGQGLTGTRGSGLGDDVGAHEGDHFDRVGVGAVLDVERVVGAIDR